MRVQPNSHWIWGAQLLVSLEKQRLCTYSITRSVTHLLLLRLLQAEGLHEGSYFWHQTFVVLLL
jgi:hypothetical protein